jgi:hypothetical protein
MLGSFGQGRGPLSGIESECEAHSDRARSRKRDGVRIRRTFGQGEVPQARTSPNARHIRTGRGLASRMESEYEAHSDRDEVPQAEWRPNTWHIRTGRGPLSGIESECIALSDRVRPSKRNRVRMLGSFGQLKVRRAETSPNTWFHSARQANQAESCRNAYVVLIQIQPRFPGFEVVLL